MVLSRLKEGTSPFKIFSMIKVNIHDCNTVIETGCTILLVCNIDSCEQNLFVYVLQKDARV
jgi:hypothetical protein